MVKLTKYIIPLDIQRQRKSLSMDHQKEEDVYLMRRHTPEDQGILEGIPSNKKKQDYGKIYLRDKHSLRKIKI